MKKITQCVALIASLTTASAMAQDFSKIEIETIAVADNIFMLKGAGGNVGVSVGEDGVLLIDAQYEPMADKIKAAVAKLSNKPARFLLNTHWHFDHTGGNKRLNDDAVVSLAQKNVRTRMMAGGVIAAFGKTVDPALGRALPELTFEQEIEVHFNNDTVVAKHMAAAHTDGDAVVFFKEDNVVHMGDLYFNGVFPFVDLSSGGGVQGVLDGVNAALDSMDENTKVIPGHGALSNKAELQRYGAMLSSSIEKVAAAKAKGADLKQVQADNVLKDLDAEWGKGFIKLVTWTEFVYRSMD